MAAVLERRPPHKLKQNDWLVKQSFNITSQGGEDGVIAQIFQILDAFESRDAGRRRWCVEFGAWDGKHLSNTWNLLHNLHDTWSGVLIEADAGRVAQMQRMYANHPNVTCVNSFIALDGDDRLTKILERANPALPRDFDLISIDIDGADYHVWAELEAYDPKVVIVEFNPSIPNNIVYIQARSTNIYHGSSLAALIDLGKKKGERRRIRLVASDLFWYELVSTTTFNAFFVKKQYYELFHIKDNDINKMHDVTMPTEFFQLYDGTIKITGCKKLIWKKLPIHDQNIQVLPASERRFPCLPTDFDIVSTAEKHFETCRREQRQDVDFFIRHGREAFQKYSQEDVGRVLRFAIQVCGGVEEKDTAVDRVWHVCIEFYQQELSQGMHQHAIKWSAPTFVFSRQSSQFAEA
ncbi:hypothetical protein FI667_g4021, partial [Globisporangium splendens]